RGHLAAAVPVAVATEGDLSRADRIETGARHRSGRVAAVQEEGDGAVVDQIELHVCLEAPGGDRHRALPGRRDERLEARARRLGRGRVAERRPAASAAIAIEREL